MSSTSAANAGAFHVARHWALAQVAVAPVMTLIQVQRDDGRQGGCLPVVGGASHTVGTNRGRSTPES